MAKNILHMLSSMKHMSPFDVNMALDAGFEFSHIVRERHPRRNHAFGSGCHVFPFPARRGSYMHFLRRK